MCLKTIVVKRIVIELSEEQYESYLSHVKRGGRLNLQEETFSGYSLKLCTAQVDDWLEVEMYGKLDLGQVNWWIE